MLCTAQGARIVERSSPRDNAVSGIIRLSILIIILILLLVGALPNWDYSRGWGYYPGGGLGIILIIVIILVLMGRI